MKSELEKEEIQQVREFVELLCKKQQSVECEKAAKVKISAHSSGVPRKAARKLESEVSCDDFVIKEAFN